MKTTIFVQENPAILHEEGKIHYTEKKYRWLPAWLPKLLAFILERFYDAKLTYLHQTVGFKTISPDFDKIDELLLEKLSSIQRVFNLSRDSISHVLVGRNHFRQILGDRNVRSYITFDYFPKIKDRDSHEYVLYHLFGRIRIHCIPWMEEIVFLPDAILKKENLELKQQ